MSGGIKKTVKVVSQEDCDKLLVSIKDELAKDAQKDLTNQAKNKKEYVFNSSLIFPQDISSSCDPAVGTETDKLTGKAKVHYMVFLYKDNDLKALLKAQALKDLDPTKDLANDSFSKFDISDKKADLENKKLTLKINTNLVIIPKMDLNLIKNNILGKDRDSAVKYLNTLPKVKKIEINFTPTFIKRIPRNVSRIIIDVRQAK
jgi:Ni,Fe-hydrogenase III component G